MLPQPSARLHAGTAIALCFAIGGLLLAGSASADDRERVRIMRAENLAAEGRCEESLAALAGVQKSSRTAELEVLAGRCELKLGRYADASARMSALEAREPGTRDAALVRAIALYHSDDFDGASAALDAARGLVGDEAEFDLYTGLVLLQSADLREGAIALERARRANPTSVEPVASYYAALAWHAVGQRERALAALARVKQRDPGGEWARQAEAALAEGENERDWWVEAMVGFEYDSNVILLADGASAFDGKSEDDFRGVWSLHGGAELLRTRNWAGGLTAAYAGNAHLDRSSFDTNQVSAGAYLDRVLTPATWLRFQADYTYSWVGYDHPFSQTLRATDILTHHWGEFGTTELSVGFEWSDYRFPRFDSVTTAPPPAGGSCPTPNTACGPLGLNESDLRNRDGVGVTAGIEHRIPFDALGATARAGYQMLRYWSQGSEYDFYAHQLHLGVNLLLPFEISLDLLGRVTFQPFDNPSTFPDPRDWADSASLGTPWNLSTRDRSDLRYGASAALERALSERVSASAQYRYTRSESNSGFFDYERHIVGTYVTVRFP